MPSPFTIIAWNKYEAALLVDAYLRVARGEMPRKEAVKQLSDRLRYRMIVNGLEISDKYRNENGVQLQMSIIEYAITKGQRGLPTPSNLFKSIAEMSIQRRDEFAALLDEAIKMYPNPAKAPTNEAYHCNNKNMQVNENIPQETILLNAAKEVLSSNFPKGIRTNSLIDRRRFKECFSKSTGRPCTMTDEELVGIWRKCGVEKRDKIYITDKMLPAELKERIFDYINDSFSSGRDYVFYECLYRHFSDELVDTLIATEGLLCTYLKQLWGDKCFFGREYMSKHNDVCVDVNNMVITYVREQWRVLSEDEVVSNLPYLPEKEVRCAFNRNQNVLIAAERGKKFHIDKFEISDKEMSLISQTIDRVVDDCDYMVGDELLAYVRQSVPSVINNNPDIPNLGIRKALAVLLRDKFDFSNAVISRKGKKLTARETLLAFAKNHEHYTLDEVKDLAQSLGTTINYHLEALLQYSVRINETNFVAKDKVVFDTDAIDKTILKHIRHSSISFPIGSIENLSAFPECNYPWTLWLLESYLFTGSDKFKLYVNGSLHQHKVCGAVSVKNADINFVDLMSFVLAESNAWTNREEALNLLASEGYLAKRQFAEIDDAIKGALELRNKQKKK